MGRAKKGNGNDKEGKKPACEDRGPSGDATTPDLAVVADVQKLVSDRDALKAEIDAMKPSPERRAKRATLAELNDTIKRAKKGNGNDKEGKKAVGTGLTKQLDLLQLDDSGSEVLLTLAAERDLVKRQLDGMAPGPSKKAMRIKLNVLNKQLKAAGGGDTAKDQDDQAVESTETVDSARAVLEAERTALQALIQSIKPSPERKAARLRIAAINAELRVRNTAGPRREVAL